MPHKDLETRRQKQKEYQRRYRRSLKGRETRWRYNQHQKGKRHTGDTINQQKGENETGSTINHQKAETEAGDTNNHQNGERRTGDTIHYQKGPGTVGETGDEMTTSPVPATGSGKSPYFKTSGPPYCSMKAAFIVFLPLQSGADALIARRSVRRMVYRACNQAMAAS